MYNDALGNSLKDEELMSSSPSSCRPPFYVSPFEEKDEAIEEETAASIQTVHRISTTLPLQTSRSEGSTPLRKINPLSAFKSQQQNRNYSSATTTNITNEREENDCGSSSSSLYSTGKLLPTKAVESKLLSMWHNVKYGWSGKLKSSFSEEQPVWLLGKCYHRRFSSSPSAESIPNLLTLNTMDETMSGPGYSSQYITPRQEQSNTTDGPQELGEDVTESQQVTENPWEEGIEGFKRDFYTRIWMTYRREFPILNGSNYTSDCGWGCMLRSGQMLMAQALIHHFLGRSWRHNPELSESNTYEDYMHRKIIRWFGDSSSKNNPFSIHTLVQLGEKMGKKPGDWYGPASVSYLIREAFRNAAQENADFDNIVLYVARDSTIYLQDIEAECQIPQSINRNPDVPWRKQESLNITASSSSGNYLQWKSLILLIPLRLGPDKLNLCYAHCLKTLLSTEYCVGIIGGRPKHSLYFVGFQEDKLIHLDPHYCQEMVDISQPDFPLHTFHCKSPRKLKLSKLDPSCCIGFYLKYKTDLDNFIESIQMYLQPISYASPTSGGNKNYKNVELTQKQQLRSPTSNYGSGCRSKNKSSFQYNEKNYYPLFTFSREDHSHHEDDSIDINSKELHHQSLDDNAKIDKASESDNDEFVML